MYSRLRLIEPPRDQVTLTRLSGEIYLPKIYYFEDITVYFMRNLLEYEYVHIDIGFILIGFTILHYKCDI